MVATRAHPYSARVCLFLLLPAACIIMRQQSGDRVRDLPVRDLYNFVLDGEHTLLVNGVICCTVGRDCGDRLRKLRPDHVSFVWVNHGVFVAKDARLCIRAGVGVWCNKSAPATEAMMARRQRSREAGNENLRVCERRWRAAWVLMCSVNGWLSCKFEFVS